MQVNCNRGRQSRLPINAPLRRCLLNDYGCGWVIETDAGAGISELHCRCNSLRVSDVIITQNRPYISTRLAFLFLSPSSPCYVTLNSLKTFSFVFVRLRLTPFTAIFRRFCRLAVILFTLDEIQVKFRPTSTIYQHLSPFERLNIFHFKGNCDSRIKTVSAISKTRLRPSVHFFLVWIKFKNKAEVDHYQFWKLKVHQTIQIQHWNKIVKTGQRRFLGLLRPFLKHGFHFTMIFFTLDKIEE